MRPGSVRVRGRMGLRWLVALVLLVAVGCSSDGRELREPGTGGATPRPTVVTTTAVDLFANALDGEFAVASSAIAQADFIPYRFSRAGDNISPPLMWQNVPDGAVELVLVVTDVSASGFVHWVIGGLDPTSVQLFEGDVPPGAIQTVNGFGELGWGGPSPPVGDAAHSYLFRLFAMGEPSGLIDGSEGFDALGDIENKAIGVATLTAFYQHLDP